MVASGEKQDILKEAAMVAAANGNSDGRFLPTSIASKAIEGCSCYYATVGGEGPSTFKESEAAGGGNRIFS